MSLAFSALNFPDHDVECAPCRYFCVSTKHDVAILVNTETYKLHVYSMSDGALVRIISSTVSCFSINGGGVCICPDGDSVLVADFFGHSLNQVNFLTGARIRSIGNSLYFSPNYVDCNPSVIVVATSGSYQEIRVLSWESGALLRTFGGPSDQSGFFIKRPSGIKLLRSGDGILVADADNYRFWVLDFNGIPTPYRLNNWKGKPIDVLEHTKPGTFIIVSRGRQSYCGVFGEAASPGLIREFRPVWAAVALPNEGLAVLEEGRIIVFKGLELRFAWIEVCVRAAATVRE